MSTQEQTDASGDQKGSQILVLIGTQGSGKSSTGNSLLGRRVFETGVGSKGTTTEMKREPTSFEGRDVTIIDTKGLERPWDIHNIWDNLSIEEKSNVIFAINIAIGRYTEDEKLLITSLLSYYRSILKKVIILFTREDEITKYPGNTFEKWLEDVPSLVDLIKTYDIKYMTLDNRNPVARREDVDTFILSAKLLEPTTCSEYVWCKCFELRQLKFHV